MRLIAHLTPLMDDRGSTAALLALLATAGTAWGDVVYSNDFESGAVGTEWSDQTVDTQADPFGSFLGRFERGTVSLTLGGGGTDGGGNPGSGSATKDGQSQPINGSRGRGGLSGLLGNGGPTRKFFDGPGNGGGNGGGGVTPGIYNISFDLYLFDSWDGLDPTYGRDSFQVSANGELLFDEALETFEPWENRLGGWERPESNVYAGWAKDLMYRNIQLSFSVEAGTDTIVIDFTSLQNQVLIDESWGIDNVVVSTAQLRGASAPAVPSVPGVGLLGASLLALGGRRRR